MSVTVLSSHEFSGDVSRARRAANEGPVVITDGGKWAYVLLRYDEYRKLRGHGPNLHEALVQPGGDAIDFEPARLGGGIFRAADLS